MIQHHKHHHHSGHHAVHHNSGGYGYGAMYLGRPYYSGSGWHNDSDEGSETSEAGEDEGGEAGVSEALDLLEALTNKKVIFKNK